MQYCQSQLDTYAACLELEGHESAFTSGKWKRCYSSPPIKKRQVEENLWSSRGNEAKQQQEQLAPF